MPTRKRGDSYMADFRIDGKRFRVSFPTKREADIFEQETRLKALKGERVSPAEAKKTMTLQDAYEAVYARKWRGSKGEESAVRNAKRVLSVLGDDLPLRDLGLEKVDKLVTTLMNEKKANSTINRHLARLKTMLKHAHQRGWMPELPHIELLKEPPPRLRYLSPSEETRLLGYFQYIGREDMRGLVIVLLDTGMRLSNGVNLTLSQFNGKVITIHGEDAKGGMTYSVPVTSRVRDILQTAREEGRTKVFPKIRTRHHARTLWDKGRDALGLTDDKNFVPHACRHTFCSRLVQRGVPLTTVKELAGHKTIEMTMRYAHLRGQDLENAIAALEPAEEVTPEKGLKIAT